MFCIDVYDYVFIVILIYLSFFLACRKPASKQNS